MWQDTLGVYFYVIGGLGAIVGGICRRTLWLFVGRQSFVYLGLFEIMARGIWDGS